jgi:hypothetical protein
MNRYLVVLAVAGALLRAPASGLAQSSSQSLVGTWTLTAADVIKTDGTRSEDYGPQPRGLAVFTADGHYTVLIFRAERVKFAGNDRLHGTAAEYKDAVLSQSTHFGTYMVDAAKGTITFRITGASFPNQDGTTQVRPFTLHGDELTWRVAPRPDGSIPVSSFKRVS